MHANAAETGAILAIDPGLVDMDKANTEFPPFPDYKVNTGPVHTAFFFTSPGSVCWATKSGTWGDATQATKELGERYLQAGVDATIAVLADLEKTIRRNAAALRLRGRRTVIFTPYRGRSVMSACGSTGWSFTRSSR